MFSEKVKQAMPGKKAIQDFAKVIKNINETTLEYFNSKVQESIVESATWSYEEQLNELKESLKEQSAKIKEDQLKKLTNELKV